MAGWPGDRLLVASHNRGKVEEFADLLKPRGIAVVGAGDLGLAVPDETEATFLGNARLKARAALAATGLPALADDSGLSVDALDGAPGVRTADWAEGPDGRDFGMAMGKVWDALETCGAQMPRLAQFRCTLVLAWPAGDETVAEGVLPGRLVWPPRGDKGHGYDPMFQPDGFAETCGEMDRWEKNRISHRGRAVAALLRAIDVRSGA
jgi:XTP/dITP diphosphohydrolase